MPGAFHADEFRADRPVPENALLLDPLDGQKFLVEEICLVVPKPIMRTRSAGRLNTDQLMRLRKRANYVPNEYCLPLDTILFFTEPTELHELLA